MRTIYALAHMIIDAAIISASLRYQPFSRAFRTSAAIITPTTFRMPADASRSPRVVRFISPALAGARQDGIYHTAHDAQTRCEGIPRAETGAHASTLIF